VLKIFVVGGRAHSPAKVEGDGGVFRKRQRWLFDRTLCGFCAAAGVAVRRFKRAGEAPQNGGVIS
jgi:hypothetical protein